MNYFELYDIPVSFTPDKKEVSRKYFALQKKYHPDFFANESETDQVEALEWSAMANKAYKTFQSSDATIRYVLQLKGLLEEEEKYKLPPDFLMEVLELNEMKMDGADDTAIRSRAIGLQEEIYGEVKSIIENYRDGQTSEADLFRVKDYYYKSKYLYRILEGS